MSNRLKSRIKTWDPADTVAHSLFETVPSIFNSSMAQYREWRRQLGHRLGVDENEIIIVGSAACGYSLSPRKPLKKFGAASDVDVAVISRIHFERAWDALRDMDISDPRITADQRQSIKQHRDLYVYWGCIATDKILSLMPFAHDWMPARSWMAGVEPTIDRDINLRLYKDFRALSSYQTNGIRKLRAALA